MAASKQPEGKSDGDDLSSLNRAYTAIVNEARAQVAAGSEPQLDELEERLRAATRHAGERTGSPAIAKAESQALQQLARVATVFRARTLLAGELNNPSPAPSSPKASLRSRLKIRPTITGNLDVQRRVEGDRLTLAWDSVPAVAEWEVRFSERPDPRGSYVVLDTLILPPGETTVDVPIGEHLFRVNILGRSRDVRPLRRALISSLTRETWNDRWERRASAS